VARETRVQVLSRIDSSASDDASARETLSTIASGQNPDGTTFVLPVSDTSTSTLAAPAADVAGVSVAPAIGAVIADTGALAAGDYRFEIEMGIADPIAVGKDMRVEHRNAANNASNRTGPICAASDSTSMVISRRTMAASERLRVVVGPVAGAASSTYGASIRAYLL
jgi:hypothetical protein